MRQSKLTTCWLLVGIVIGLFIISGCGSLGGGTNQENAASTNEEDAASTNVPCLIAGADFVNIIRCYGCHSDDNKLTGCSAVVGDSDTLKLKGEGWLNGPHGNYESIDEHHQEQDLGPNNVGFPAYGYSGLGTSPDCSTKCHDPLEDGKKIQPFFQTASLDLLGKQNRPIIGCESCHGPGGMHNGIGPLAWPVPGPDKCGQCHDDGFPDAHLTYHPEGDRVFEDYRTSAHARTINSHTLTQEGSTSVRAKCSRCHTEQGAKQFISLVKGAAPYSDINELMIGKPDIGSAAAVQCRTCHDSHNPLRLLGEKSEGLPPAWSSEFKTCTSCHQFLKEDGTLLTEAYHDPAINTHGSEEEIITDTHYDDPNTGNIEGYIVDPNSTHSGLSVNINRGTCRDCHNPHDADTTINRQWAKSAHGGHLAEVRELNSSKGGAIHDPNVAVTEAEGPAWVHYDFKGSNRKSCQRCHTATGFRNFANGPALYNPDNTVFSARGQQKELLYCWACHTSNKGGLRNPGVFSQTAPYATPASRIASVPDLAGSNLCMACHSGSKNSQVIKDISSIDGKSFSSFNSHYLVAGGILFRISGYEFSGRDYANSYFKHGLIGTSSAPGTGTNGPCVGCHMRTKNSHLLLAVEEDPNGLITEITANDQICATCHQDASGMAVTTEGLNRLREGYEASINALKEQLKNNGIYYSSKNPYFYDSDGVAFTNWPDRDTLGAAFNLNLLVHEPGAYVHNQLYTRRLIFDSIDLLDDKLMNSSVGNTLGSGPAFEYLRDVRS